MEEYDISDAMGELIEKAVNIDLDHLRNSRTIQPWVLSLTTEGRYTMGIISDLDFDAAMAEARKRVAGQKQEIDAYLIGFHGTIPTTDGPVKGLFYEIGEKGNASGYQYMVGYELSGNNEVEVLEGYNGVLEQIPNLIFP